ncbi:MAG TPA: tripartite tricarboxylate transporter TctB family protein [Candidatus Limnocylindria bacterium]|nr:tripartite tricarboxylate transporter TctB family protein [Candidatus Limnocylindria bacterium]
MRLEGLLFTGIIGIALAGAVWIAGAWPLRASIAILVLGCLGVLLAVWQVILDWKAPAGAAKRSQFEVPMAASETRWGNVEIWSWIVGYFLLIHVIGCPIAVPLFVLAYSKFYNASWPLAVGLGTLAGSFVYGVFEKILHVPWPEPLIQTLFVKLADGL